MKDSERKGAGDFYFAINATFRYLLKHEGIKGWITYLEDLGKEYYRPVNERWKAGGLNAIARYWREFFDAEPGSNVEVENCGDRVELVVHRCPAIAHLREHGRKIVPRFCQHCYYLNQTRAREAGVSMTVTGGAGACVHTYYRDPGVEQDLGLIREVAET